MFLAKPLGVSRGTLESFSRNPWKFLAEPLGSAADSTHFALCYGGFVVNFLLMFFVDIFVSVVDIYG